MAGTAPTDMKLSKEFKLGIFVLVVLAATFVVINLLRGTDLLGREITVCGCLADAETLVPSAPVQYKGYTAGRVDKVEYDPATDRFIVSCSVEKQFRLPKDSKMVIYSTSIMGGKGVKLVPGSSSECVSDGDTLATESETDLLAYLSGQVDPLLQRIYAIADSLTVTVNGVNAVLDEKNRASLEATLAHLQSTMRNADRLASSIGGRSEELSAMITNLQNVSERFVPIADSVALMLGNVNTIADSLSKADLGGTVEGLGATAKSATAALDQLRTPLEKLLCDADSLINAISENPKKYIKITVF